MESALFKLNLRDVGKGIALTVIVVVLGALQQGFTEYGFDIMSFDWSGILNLAWMAGVGYLTKNLLSTEDGKVLGHIG